jgi:hypothetical protein
MIAATLDILREPRGDAYAALLALAAERCASFSLVWPDRLAASVGADTVAVSLSPDLVREARVAQWPGTQLLDDTARVRHYALTPESLLVLRSAPGLYAWQGPNRPEDLAFYTADGTVWLGSVAHEADAWFTTAAMAADDLPARLPQLALGTRAAAAVSHTDGAQAP